MNSFNRFLQVSPMHKKSGHKTPHIALSLSVYQNDLKSGDILTAVFELSMCNHSKGTYHGCKGSFWNYVKPKHIITNGSPYPCSISFGHSSLKLKLLSIILWFTLATQLVWNLIYGQILTTLSFRFSHYFVRFILSSYLINISE